MSEIQVQSQQEHNLSKVFPVKPKLKPKSKTPSRTPESKYWLSFKNTEIDNLVSSIPSISFSPIAPHNFAVSHSGSLTLYSPLSFEPVKTISSFRDVVTCSSFRSDGQLIAAADLSGQVQVFDVKHRDPLRRLRSHTRPVRFVKYSVVDKLHLVSGGDDGFVKYWDVASESVVFDLFGHKDYVRCGDCCPVNGDLFVTGSYDHVVKLWDVRVNEGKSVLEVNHGKPVEDVVFLPSGGLVATAGGNSVKIWDVIGGGKLVGSMESHNKTLTSLCVGKVGKDGGDESQQFRILSVALDGYMKVFDYSRMKVTHSMRFPAPLMSVGFSPDCMMRVIGTSKGVVFAGRRKTKESVEGALGDSLWRIAEPQKPVLRPSYYRYFHRGQNEKPSEGDVVVLKPKKVKLAEHDKLLKKFRHKDALVSVLGRKNPEDVVAVMEELVTGRKLLKCVSNLDVEELGLLLIFLHKYSTLPRYSSFLMDLTKRVLELRAEDIRNNDVLRCSLEKSMLALKDIVPAAGNNINAQFILLDKGRICYEGQNKTCLALVADETAAVHFLFWGDECEAFEPGDILCITNGIFSYSRNNLVLRAGRRGKVEKVGEFAMTYVETPNMSEIRWVPDRDNTKRYVQEAVISSHSRIFPPLP